MECKVQRRIAKDKISDSLTMKVPESYKGEINLK